MKDEAAEILRATEGQIAKLAGSATSRREYDVAEQLLAAARQLGTMADRLLGKPAATASNGPAAASHDGAKDSDGDDAPVFERDHDELVKLGNSKDGKRYEHKAPRATVDLLLAAIQAKATKTGDFRARRILPLKDENGQKVPEYQGYLSLRWLRHIGLVERVARERYRLKLDIDPVTCVGEAWEALHQR